MKISVKVVPNAKVEKVEVNADGSLKIWMRSKPIDGEANKKLVEILSKHYKVAKRDIEIVLGETSRNKIVNIVDR